jgi:hypothetical protein
VTVLVSSSPLGRLPDGNAGPSSCTGFRVVSLVGDIMQELGVYIALRYRMVLGDIDPSKVNAVASEVLAYAGTIHLSTRPREPEVGPPKHSDVGEPAQVKLVYPR